ncbi:DUF6382 domain-containing protein [Paenibacillus larvae]
MIRKVYGLHYEFIQQRGHFMVLSKTAGLKKEDVIQVELYMANKQTIPHLLPFRLEETDGVAKLVYDVTSKRMLSHTLKTEPLKAEELLEFLSRLTSILIESGNYMLREESFLLEDRFMFIGKQFKELFLTYVPVRQHSPVPVKRQIQLFLESLLQKCILDNHSLFTPLLHYCTAEDFYLKGFKELAGHLLEQAGNSPNVLKGGENQGGRRLSPDFEQVMSEEKSIPQIKEDGTPVFRWIGGMGDGEERDDSGQSYAEAAVSHNREIERNSIPDPWGQRDPGEDSVSWQDADKLLEEDSVHFSKRTVFIIYTAASVIIILFWKIYLDRQEEALLYIAGGVTLFLPAAIYALLLWLAEREPDEAGDAWPTEMQPWGNRKPEKGLFTNHPEIVQSPTGYAVQDSTEDERRNFFSKMKLSVSRKAKETEPAMSESNLPPQTLKEHYAFLSQKTTLLTASKDDATVPFQPASNPFHLAGSHMAGPADKPPFLEVYKDGQRSVIFMEKDSLTVGRGEKGVDYREDQPGISRIHFEITREAERFMIKDTGSSNGTFLNGEPLIPYQSYPLKEGDKIRVLQMEYIFFV